MMMLVCVPSFRSTTGMFSSSGAASGRPEWSRAIPPSVRISAAVAAVNPPVASVVVPLRTTIRSSGSPETFMLC
jgi:hypothetical protein